MAAMRALFTMCALATSLSCTTGVSAAPALSSESAPLTAAPPREPAPPTTAPAQPALSGHSDVSHLNTGDAPIKQRALLEWLRHGDRGSLASAAATTRPYDPSLPPFLYDWFLLAYAHRALGHPEREQQVLSGLGEPVEDVYRYFFHAPEDELRGNLECIEAMQCLERQERRGRPVPGTNPFLFVNKPALEDHLVCEKRTFDPTTCPDSYMVFERITTEFYGRNRLRAWSRAQGGDVTMESLLEQLEITPGMDIADVGAGEGYFTLPFAEAVGPEGTVWAIELGQPFLAFIDTIARGRGLHNVRTKLGDEGGIGLPPESVDLVYLCDVFKDLTWEESQAIQRGDPSVLRPFMESVRTALRPGGHFVVIDSDKLESGTGGQGVVTTMHEVQGMVEAKGFRLVRRLDIFDPVETILVFEAAPPVAVTTY